MSLFNNLPRQFLEVVERSSATSRQIHLSMKGDWIAASAGGLNEGSGVTFQTLPSGTLAIEILKLIHDTALDQMSRQIPLELIFDSPCTQHSYSETRTQIKRMASCSMQWMSGNRLKNWRMVESILLSLSPRAVDEYLLLSREYFESLCIHGDPIKLSHAMMLDFASR